MLTRAEGEWTKKEARHLLNRAGFGGAPQEIEALFQMGREKAVESLLGGDDEEFALPEWTKPENVREMVMEMMDARRETQQDSEMSAQELEKARREAQKKEQQIVRDQENEAKGWWFRRMLKTKLPLREKMTLFWHDHFATSLQKVRRPVFMLRQNELFRRHAFGNFRDLTQEIVRDPAMMLYLDVQRSNKDKPNENFAREVMELFTLGEGHYTEEDIKQAARAFTGYDLRQLTGEVVQSRRKWDDGEKTIFGQTGKFNGRDVIKLIFQKERCAEFMAEKIWEYFVQEKPEAGVVKFLADVFRKADYEMKPLLKEVFLSKEFYAASVMGNQIKSPVQYLLQLMKELEVTDIPLGFGLQGQVQLGQVLFMPPNVAGWDWGKAWINTNTLLIRYNLAGVLTKGSYEEGRRGKDMKGGNKGMNEMRNARGVDFERIAAVDGRNEVEELVKNLVERFFSIEVPEKARKSFMEYAESKRGISFSDKELGELCHLMLSTPYYQLC